MSRVTPDRNFVKCKKVKITRRPREKLYGVWAFEGTGARGSLGQQQIQGSSVMTGRGPSSSMETSVQAPKAAD